MTIRITTNVSASFSTVKTGFNAALFKKLSPPFPIVQLIRFDGSKKGDIVSLSLNFLLFKQQWTSVITEDFSDFAKWRFVDEGTELPFFLKIWRHQHEVMAINSGSAIVDDIKYSSGNSILDLVLYPFILMQFLYRKPIYKRIFHKKAHR